MRRAERLAAMHPRRLRACGRRDRLGCGRSSDRTRAAPSISSGRINYGDSITGQTGRWFVPFDICVGKKFTDNIALSLEVGVPILKDFPV